MSYQARVLTVTPVTGRPLGRLLLIETDAVVSGEICQFLVKVGFSVSLVRCLRDAIRQLSSAPDYSAIICEYYLRDGTGLELLDRLRDDQDLRVPMLLISGYWSRPLPSQRGLEFLTKPFHSAQLLGALNGLLQRSPVGRGLVAPQPPLL